MGTVQNYGEILDSFDLKIENLRNLSAETYLSEYVISIKEEKSYCVGRADMIDANRISAIIGIEKAAKYYQLFLNSMSYVLGYFGGYVIKNLGNSILYYFPESGKRDSRLGFMSCIECGIAMTQIHEEMQKIAVMQGLPRINYNISSDYGRVAVIDASGTKRIDLFGSPMNTCSKINHKYLPNRFVIGNELYEIVKGYDEYVFRKQKNAEDIQEEHPFYLVSRNQDRGEKVCSMQE